MSTNNPGEYLQEMSGSRMVEEGEETSAPNPTVRQEVIANPSPSLLKLKRHMQWDEQCRGRTMNFYEIRLSARVEKKFQITGFGFDLSSSA